MNKVSLKYLVLSSASTAILLFGGALLYAGTGTLGFSEMGDALADANVVFVTIGARVRGRGLRKYGHVD